MRKTVLAAVAATGLAITGASGVALGAGDDRNGRTPAAVAAAPSASATADDDRRDRREGFGRDDATPAPAGDTAVDRTRAWAIAQVRAGGGRVTKTELEREDGRLVWKIEVYVGTVEYDVRIDARTGEVVRLKWRDRGSDDRGEFRDDRGFDDSGSGRGSDDDRRGRGRGSDDGAGDDNGGDRSGGGHGSDDPPGDDRGGDRDDD